MLCIVGSMVCQAHLNFLLCCLFGNLFGQMLVGDAAGLPRQRNGDAMNGAGQASASSQRPSEELQLPITNCTSVFKACLDYIWITPQRGLQIDEAVGGVPQSLLFEDVGLPSPRFPSDHLPVTARLTFLY